MKRLLAILIVGIYLFSLGFTCYAYAESADQRASELIMSRSLNISENSDAVIATASIACYADCDKIGFSSLVIQENRNGVWTTVSSTSGYGYNVEDYIKSLTYANVKSGKQYRAKCTFVVKEGSTTETRYSTTSALTI